MAIGIHVARVGLFTVDSSTGVRIDKESGATTINQMKNINHDHLVIPDAGITNSANYPTVKSYLELEAGDDFILGHLDQYMIITYDRGAMNDAS
jgi:hypothetical protein